MNRKHYRRALSAIIVIATTGSLYHLSLPEPGPKHCESSTNQSGYSATERPQSKALNIARSSQAQRAARDAQVPKGLLTQKRLVAKISVPLAKVHNATTESAPKLEYIVPTDWPSELDAQTWLTRPAVDWYPAMAELYHSGQLKTFAAAIHEFRKRNPNDPVDTFVKSLSKPTALNDKMPAPTP